MKEKINNINQNILDIKIIIGLLIAAIFLWILALGNLPLRDWDEGYYGTVAKDMFHQKNWLYPTYLGEPFFLKPPLIFWLISISYSLMGISELTTRLPVAILTACGVPLLYLIGKELFSSRLPAIFTALVYLTLLPIVRHGRLAMLDGMINTFFLLSLFCLLKSQSQPIWLIGVGIGLGLITLSKGILVLVLGGILLVFLLINKQLKIFKNYYLWLGILLGFLPVFAWYFAQIQEYGTHFLQVHFQEQSFNRLSTAVEGNRGPIWYYLIELVKYTLPWLLFLPGGLVLAWQKRQQSWANLAIIGIVMYLGTISLMGTKLPWYIMPIYPFFALTVGAYLAHLWQSKKKYSLTIIVFLSLLGIAALGGGVYFSFTNPQPALIMMAIVLGITMILTAWKLQQNNKIFIPILMIGLYITLALLMISKNWIWELNEAFPVKPVAALIQTHTPSDIVVYSSLPYTRPSLDFYSDHKVISVDHSTLKRLANQKGYLLLDKATLESLALTHSLLLGEAEGFTLVVSQPDSNSQAIF